MPWPTGGLRRASVNSFGFGGTNSHAVLDDAYNFLRLRKLAGNHCTVRKPPSSAELRRGMETSCHNFPNGILHDVLFDGSGTEPKNKLLVLSTADEKALERLIRAYSQHFTTMVFDAQVERKYITDLTYTLDARRSSLPWKSFSVVSSCSMLRELESNISKPVRSTINPKLGFIFTGQGAQWYAMGRELLIYPAFKTSLLHSEHYLQTLGCRWLLLGKINGKQRRLQLLI